MVGLCQVGPRQALFCCSRVRASCLGQMRDVLHPNQFCDFLLTIAPAGTPLPPLPPPHVRSR